MKSFFKKKKLVERDVICMNVVLYRIMLKEDIIISLYSKKNKKQKVFQNVVY